MPGAAPLRTCVACRTVRPQDSLVRITLSGDRLVVGRGSPGRGAYLCPGSPACIAALVKKRPLGRALRAEVAPEAVEELVALLRRDAVSS